MDKKKLETKIKMIRMIVAQMVRPEVIPGACLYYASVVNVLTGAPIMAGSYSWKITNFDNGQNPNYFSCIFDDVAQAKARRILAAQHLPGPGFLPEMHIWNVYQGKVLDLTTAHIQE